MQEYLAADRLRTDWDVQQSLTLGEADVGGVNSAAETRGLLLDAAQRAACYLESCDARPVLPTPAALERLAELDIPLPDAAQPASKTLCQLDEIASPATVATAGGRFFGFVHGGALPVSVATNWLATAWDQNTALPSAAPAAAEIERVALRWLLELFGLPEHAAGAFVTGTTMAHFSALAAARHALLRQQGWDVDADGLFGAPAITVLVGDEAHPTLFKALGLLGLGRRRVLRVPVDAQGRMRADKWPTFGGPAIVCLQAGNVNTGAFDPFNELIDLAHSTGAWVHVDGAFGLWASASSRQALLTAGINRADSWACDAHKWLNVPYDSGLAFVRDANALRAAMAVSAEYFPEQGSLRTPSAFTPELSRRARGVDIWAVLRTLVSARPAAFLSKRSPRARLIAAACRQSAASTAVV
ncbi:pyridoxal phosphate-dependent decarboxylase family protein [Azohydromonas australica]|uniref:pyridoxal phosphate-dependent decarboxylase family protein n=1 Tax=Azohydromonas australica TaxID=364039 RepID=UPI000A06D662|nr:pyridoxal-dependent decarboxylase [Azohydromonas australica]